MQNSIDADAIGFSCPHCQAPLKVPRALSGQTFTCQACQRDVVVPDAPATAAVSLAVPQLAAVPLAGEAAPASAPVPPTMPQLAAAPLVGEAAPASAGIPPVVTELPVAPAAGAPEIELLTPAQVHQNAVASPHAAAVEAPRPHWPAPRAEVRVSPKARPAPASSRMGLWALCAVVVLALGGGWLVVSNRMERQKTEAQVGELMDQAQQAFQANDVELALTRAKEAERVITQSPQHLDEQRRKAWETSIEQVKTAKKECDNFQTVFDGAQNELKRARTNLEAEKLLLGSAGADKGPQRAKLDALLAELTRLEHKQQMLALANDTAKAEEKYRSEDLEGAAVAALGIASKLAALHDPQCAPLQARLEVLQARAKQLQAAQELRDKAGKANFSATKRKLQQQLDALTPDDAARKPLAERIRKLIGEVAKAQTNSRTISSDLATGLKRYAQGLASLDRLLSVQNITGDTIGLVYDKRPLAMGVQVTPFSRRLFLVVNDYRFHFDEAKLLDQRSGRPYRMERIFKHALELGAAMAKAGVENGDDYWDATTEAPFVSARRSGDDGREYVFLKDRLYAGPRQDQTAGEKEISADFAKKTQALETAVENDSGTPEEVRCVAGVAVQAAYQEQDWYDHLPGAYVRKCLNEGYLEENLPGAVGRLKPLLEAYRAAYAKLSNPHVNFSGADAQGDEAREWRNYENQSIWRIYDQRTGVTSFAIKDPDDERDCFFTVYDFAGAVSELPDKPAQAVHMTHQALGVIATYDAAAQKLTYDQAAWDQAVRLETMSLPANLREKHGLGTPEWPWPPHVVLVDMQGNTKSLVTPFGKLDVQSFKTIADPAARQKAMDQYLDQIAKVLPTPPYLNLYYRYFFEYIYHSPLTSVTDLFGNRTHMGDIHQTAYQSLERFRGGRYIGVCADLAESFMVLTRRQGKLSYIMGLPEHAACGWVEKPAAGGDYTFYVLQTGPPLMFKDKDLDHLVEKAYRAFDEMRTEHIDPKSLGFLFRFNGEPTRTEYVLSSRMFVDREYGEAMERVQSYWHFHFYALGIQTMLRMIAKGDRVPENCNELAGLYQWVREVQDSIHWSQEAIKQFSPDQHSSRLNEEARIAGMWRMVHENEKAYAALQPVLAELKALRDDQHSWDYFSLRLEAMGLLIVIDKPWEAWDTVRDEILELKNQRQLRIEHVRSVTTLFRKMKDLLRAGKQPTVAEQNATKEVEDLLAWFYQKVVFDPNLCRDDKFFDTLGKYGALGIWYAAKYGHARFLEELLKDGPWPDPKVGRKHEDRSDPEAEDWKWIRLSLASYADAIADAIDFDEPPAKWRKEEAVKLSDAMLRASDHMRQFGSLAMMEFELFSIRVLRDFLSKDWADLEQTVREVQKRDWPKLTDAVTETFGQGGRFVTPEEFVTQYRMFTKHIKSRPAYFSVVYSAYRAEAVEQAVAAAKVAVECCPGDADMQREAKYLEQLAQKRVKK